MNGRERIQRRLACLAATPCRTNTPNRDLPTSQPDACHTKLRPGGVQRLPPGNRPGVWSHRATCVFTRPLESV